MTAIASRFTGFARRESGGTASKARKGVSAAVKGVKGIARTSYGAGKAAGATSAGLAAAASRLSSDRKARTRKAPLVLAGATGAAGAYFLDPESGNRRRAVAKDKLASLARKARERAEQRSRYAAGVAKGAAYEAGSSQAARDYNDPTLENKVESEIFRATDVPKGQVSVSVEEGVVYLRGELDSEGEIEALVDAASDVEGVRGVENLLHLPGEEAPSKSDGKHSRVAAKSS